MTKVEPIQISGSMTRLGSALGHRIVLMTIISAVVPTVITLMIVFSLEPNLPSGLWLLVPLALIGGIVLGISIQNIGYYRTEAVLQDYTEALDKVAAGDLKTRLTIPPIVASNKESEMLVHLGRATSAPPLSTVPPGVRDPGGNRSGHPLPTVRPP